MSWLLHKFAQASQNGLMILAATIGSTSMVGYGLNDVMTEDLDNITGANRDKIVEVFEGKIAEIDKIQSSYLDLSSKRNLALINNNPTNAKELGAKLEDSKLKVEKLTAHFEQEVHLSPYISEQDYVDLSGAYNDLFPMGAHEINTNAGAYLHDAQFKSDLTALDKDARSATAERVKDVMRDFKIGEEAIGARKDDGKTVLIAILTGVYFSVFGIGLAAVGENSDNLKRVAKQPTPPSPLDKIREAKERNRQRKQKLKNRIN